MAIKQLNFAFAAENVLFIFRNITYFSKFYRVLVCLLIIAEICLTVTNGLVKLGQFSIRNKSDTVYYFSALINSTVIVILSCYHSKNMKKLVAHLNANDSQLLVDSDINNKTKHEHTQQILNILSILFCAIKLFLVLHYRNLRQSSNNYFLTFICEINYVMCNCRSMLEYFVISNILSILSEQLEYIICSINEVTVNNDSEGVIIETQDQLSKFEQWCNIYLYVSEASKLLNSIFGIQVLQFGSQYFRNV